MLTARQQRFADEYLIDLNATQAAIRAGYAERSAYSQGQRLLKKDEVAAAIEEAKRERSEQTKIDSEWVLQHAVALYERCVGEVKPALHPTSRKQMKDTDGNLLFTFQAATAARVLELIGKHVSVGAFEDRLKVEHTANLIDRINAGLRRSPPRSIEAKDVSPTSGPVSLPALPKPKHTPEPERKAGDPNFRPMRTAYYPHGELNDG